MLFFCGSIKVTYAVDIVFDPQAFSKLLQQVQEARKMAKSLEEQVHTLKGKRAIGEIINQQLGSFLPKEWRNFMSLANENLSTAAWINQNRTDWLLKEVQMIAHQFKTEEIRLKTIGTLAEEASKTQDIKASQDLQNKIQTEQMVYQENMHQFEVMKATMALEEKLATHRRVLAANCGHQVAAYREFPNQFQLSSECTHLHDSPAERNQGQKRPPGDGDGSTLPKAEGKEADRIGEYVRQFESGKAGSGAISTGKGDPGGISYGTYQLSSKTGDAQQFINWSAKHGGMGKELKGLTPGTPPFSRKWTELNKRDAKAWGKEQYDFIYHTHYAPQVKYLKTRGIDVNKLGKAEKEAIWSVAVQYGKPDVIVNAFKGYDIYKMTSEQRINRIYDYKWRTRKVNFHKAYLQGQGRSLEDRIKKERVTVLGVARRE